MTDRITSEMVRASTLNDINSSLQTLQRSAVELSSGKRIIEPSDDPYGASHIIDLTSQIEGLSSYSAAIANGSAWTGAASGAMSNIHTILQRVRELVLQASNGTLNSGDLGSIAGQVTGLIESIKQDANTQYAGQYIFSGTLTTTAPYKPGAEDAFQGDTEPVNRPIGPGAVVNVATELSSVLGSGQGAADGKLLDVLRTIAGHLGEATPAAREALATTDLANLDTNMEALTNLEARTGATTNQLTAAASRIEGLQDALTKSLSATQDANIAEVSLAYSSEQAAYSAALHAGANIIQESLLDFLK